MKYYAIIVAGGSGKRMQMDIPKQFLLLKGLPVLMHTIKAFSKSIFHPEILIVLHKDQHNYWTELCKRFDFQIPHTVISGGTERFHSVQNALSTITEESLVAVHDAVRPLVSEELINSCFKNAAEIGNVVAAVKAHDSIRLLMPNGKNKALHRDDVYIIQTPQIFHSDVLKEAYKQDFKITFTDDASVVESIGQEINIVEGERNNIKITHPVDLQFATLIVSGV